MKVVRLSPELCMFIELPKPVGTGRATVQELWYAFEAVLPTPIDEVHMVFAYAGEKVVGCAIPKAALLGYQQSAEMLIPDGLPDWITAENPSDLSEQLNFLTGEFQPVRHRQRSETTRKLACFLLLVSSVLFYHGATRKADQRDTDARKLSGEISEMYDHVLPPSAAVNSQPDSIRFQTIMNQLSATRTGHENAQGTFEIIPTLGSLLQGWPTHHHAQVQSLHIDQAELRVMASFPDNHKASAMIEHFHQAHDWAMQSHQVSARSERVDLSVQLTRIQIDPGDQHD